jgi:hypothetical protein
MSSSAQARADAARWLGVVVDTLAPGDDAGCRMTATETRRPKAHRAVMDVDLARA